MGSSNLDMTAKPGGAGLGRPYIRAIGTGNQDKILVEGHTGEAMKCFA